MTSKNITIEHLKIIKEWKKNFVEAIKNDNEIELNKLLDESDKYFQGYMLSPSIDFNVLRDDNLSSKEKVSKIRDLQQEDLENIKSQILKQSRENFKYILKLMIDDKKSDFINKCGEEQIYANENFTKICETPILLSILYPFELSGIFIFCLLHENVEFKVPSALFNVDSPLNSDSHNYYEPFDEYHYKYNIFFGNSRENTKYSYTYQLKKILNFDVKNWDTNKGSDAWNLLEMIYYVDHSCYKSISKSHDIKPLLHIIDENEQYWQTLTEFTKGLNPYTIKYLIFKTLIFYNAFKIGLFIDLSFKVANFLDLDILMTNMLNGCWILPYTKIEGVKDIEKDIKEIIDSHKELVNNITLTVDKFENINETDNEIDNEANNEPNLFTECLWKLILYDQICVRKIRISFFQFINSHTLKQYKSIQNMMLPIKKNLIKFNDWNNFYNEYESDLKNIFPNLDKDSLKNLWQVANNNLLFIFPNSYNFDFNKNRLSRSRVKKFDPQYYNDNIATEVISLVALMEIANIGKSLTGDGKQNTKTKKSASQNSLINFVIPLKRFGKNTPSYSIFKVMNNIHKYSSDSIIIFLRELSNIFVVSYVLPYNDINLLCDAYNSIMKSYKIIFDSELYMQQSLEALLNYQYQSIIAENDMLSSFIPDLKKD